MPAKSARQRRFMAKAATDAAFAREHGISQAVAREFMQAGERSRERRRKANQRRRSS